MQILGMRAHAILTGVVMLAILLLGGVGWEVDVVTIMVGVAAVIGILLLVYVRGAIEYPKYFLMYAGILGLVLVGLLWSVSVRMSQEFLVLFASGGLIWILVF